jgi:hypothetical protein
MPERVAHGDVATLPFDTVYLSVPRVQDTSSSQSIGETRGTWLQVPHLVFEFDGTSRGEKHCVMEMKQGNELNGSTDLMSHAGNVT